MLFNADCPPFGKCLLNVIGEPGQELRIVVNVGHPSDPSLVIRPLSFEVSGQKSQSIKPELLCRIAMAQFIKEVDSDMIEPIVELDTILTPWAGHLDKVA